ncbi:MAG: delta-60 repeat domain-containing protein, partial [bacterium]
MWVSVTPRALAAPGELDPSFVSGGFNTNDINAVAALPDGDVYVAGSPTDYGSSTGLHGLVRLNSDGSLDTGFTMTGTGLDADLVSYTNGYQVVSVNATGGTFTLTFQGQTTSAIAYNADAP